VIPNDYVSLLERPLYGHLGTIRPDDTVQVNPMWFEFDGEHLRFTHTTKRAKFRNLEHNPAMSLSIIDPDNQFRYLELRGRLVDVEPDPTGRSTSGSVAATETRGRNPRRTARIGWCW
jgi:PPOX class probable F420-dependent enzyme